MLRIGRYGISVGRTIWVQTQVPTRVWHFLCFWVFKEARPTDIDHKRQFPLGTGMIKDGKAYRYYKAGGTIGKGDIVVKEDK